MGAGLRQQRFPENRFLISMRFATFWLLCVMAAALAAAGCQLHRSEVKSGDPELERYKVTATEIDYPDAKTPEQPHLLDEPSPLAIGRDTPPEFWDLSLTDVLRLALMHSKALSDVGGALLSPANVRTTQGPSIVETDPRFGVEATLSPFDPVLASTLNFTGNHQAINNVFFGGGTRILQEDTAVSQTSITKRTAYGGTLQVLQDMDFDASNAPGNLFPQAYNTYWQVSASQAWGQGGGALFNRVYGPPNVPGVFSGVPGFANGVLVARINTDISLADFEMGVRDLVSNVENAYWDLYFAYRDLDAKIAARDSALETWRRVHALFLTGRRGGEAEKEAEAREQYFRFQEEVQIAWFGRLVDGTRTANGSGGGTLRTGSGVRVAERRLRMLAGLPINDCKLIRPCEEPQRAHVLFEWDCMLREALARRSELRRQKWVIKRRELELLASKNFLLPTFDTTAMYRVQGFGENLLNGPNDPTTGTYENAVANLYSGQFGYWQAGANFSMPLGFRRGHAAVRNAELQLMREKVVLEQQEREVVHALSNAISEAERAYDSTLTSFNRREAARQHLAAVRAAFEADKAPPELMLESERRLAEADVRYYAALVEYVLSIKNVHFEKGSLLDYNEVHLAEGEWPDKAYRDAAQRDRSRLANKPLNYILTRRPPQVSAGLYWQGTAPLDGALATPHPGETAPSGAPQSPETLPGSPAKTPAQELPTPASPAPGAPPAGAPQQLPGPASSAAAGPSVPGSGPYRGFGPSLPGGAPPAATAGGPSPILGAPALLPAGPQPGALLGGAAPAGAPGGVVPASFAPSAGGFAAPAAYAVPAETPAIVPLPPTQ